MSEFAKDHQDLILDGTKLAWHLDRVKKWQRGERIAPITIDRKGYIINGHHRYDALRILGKKKVIVRLLNLNAKDMINLDLSAKELQKLLKHHKFNSTNVLSFIPLDEKLDSFFKKIS